MPGSDSNDRRRTGWIALQILFVLSPTVLAVEYWLEQGQPAAPFVIIGSALLLFVAVVLPLTMRGSTSGPTNARN